MVVSSIFEFGKVYYVLLNVRHPGLSSTTEFADSLVKQLKAQPEFNLQFQSNTIILASL
ncbi:MAG: hypothetical protein KME59_11670 [Trichormus sp. ATA11-4-KO1]|nr:hypothetical protein [Trichormus sp. ATA11-4-KO1]